MKQEYIKLSLDIPEDYKNKLTTIAKDREMSVSGLVRLIIKEYLKNVGCKENINRD